MRMVVEALLVVLGLGLLWALGSSLLLMRRVRRLEQALLAARAEADARLDPLEEIARDRWLAERVELGEQVSAMIEALIETTDRGMAALDRRRAEVEALLVRAERSRPRVPALVGETPTGGDAPLRPPAAAVVARPEPRRSITRSPGAEPEPTARQREVRRLAAEGLSPAEIARQTGLGVAETDLILRLGRPVPLQRGA
jgi:hypothetical protein